MPTYEYYCDTCNETFEKFQSIQSDTHIECPKCTKRLNRSMSAGTGIIFKGSGFYTTDYKKKDVNKTPDKSPSKPKTDSTSDKTSSNSEAKSSETTSSSSK